MKDQERKDSAIIVIKGGVGLFSVLYIILQYPGFDSSPFPNLRNTMFFSYLIFASIVCLFVFTRSEEYLINDYFRFWLFIFIYMIGGCVYWVLLYPVYFYDGINSLYLWLFLVSFITLLISFISGIVFLDKDNFDKEVNENLVLRESEVEARKFSPWGHYSFKKHPYLRKPLMKIGDSLVKVIIVLSLIGGGAVFGVIEILRRTVLSGSDISPYPIIIFSIGIPLLSVCGFFLYALIRNLVIWCQVVKSIKEEYGEFKLLINYDGRSYEELKPTE